MNKMSDMHKRHKADVTPRQQDTEYVPCGSIYVGTKTGKTNLCRHKWDSGFPLRTDYDCEKAGGQQSSLCTLGASYMGLLS